MGSIQQYDAVNPGWPVARLATWVLAAIVGTLALVVAFQLQDAGYKAWVILAGLAALPTVIAITGHPKELLLFGWVFSLTYNRQYFIFERVVGYNGTEGPYVILADVCLAGLFGWWLYERIMQRPSEPARSSPMWPWYLPFAATCFLTIFDAARPDWVAFEMIRIAKIGLILFYVRHNMGRREWFVTLAALAAAVSFQSGVAIKEVTTGKVGVIGASEIADAPEFLSHFENGAFTGMVRGIGTMAHPPYLACYLLLVLPVLMALSLVSSGRRLYGFGFAFLLGCGGLAATLSRWPWIVAAVQFAAVLMMLVLLRQLPVQRALGLSILAAFVLGLGLLPFREKLMNRFTGDFAESMEFRSEGMRASLEAVEDRPLLGFGLNNTAVYLGQYLPEMEWGLVTEEFASRTLHLRAPVVLGNGFMHVVEETGILGAFTFALLILSGFVNGVRAIAQTSGEQQAVSVGLLIGICGALAEQLVDAPLWVDPVLYTFILFIALLNVAPYVFRGAEVSRQLAIAS